MDSSRIVHFFLHYLPFALKKSKINYKQKKNLFISLHFYIETELVHRQNHFAQVCSSIMAHLLQ